MTRLRIWPMPGIDPAKADDGHLKGTVSVPPSKSQLHRALIAAALADGTSRIGADLSGTAETGFPLSEDISATIDCLRALGCEISIKGKEITVKGMRLAAQQSEADKQPLVLPVRASASTLRFLIPLAFGLGRPVRFTGEKALFGRPLSVYEEISRERGDIFRKGQLPDGQAFLDISMDGTMSFPLPEVIRIRGDISSQFVSGLLFVLPLLQNDSRIELIPPVVSRPYIELTRQMLEKFGVRTSWMDDRKQILVPGGQQYSPADVTIEGDESQAAFIEALSLLDPKSEIALTGLDPATRQGDKAFTDLAGRLMEPSAAGQPASGPEPIDLSDIPDLGPILFVMAAAGKGGTFTATGRLREKESDRVRGMAEELAKCGIGCEIGEDFVTILPGTLHTPDMPLHGHGDHRIVMALSVLLTKTGGVIEGVEAVAKSDPAFFERLRSLGLKIEEA